MTQREKVKKALFNRGYITARQAYHMGIMRLASIIWALKNEDVEFSEKYEIRTDTLKVKNRDGSFSYVAKYVLMKRPFSDVSRFEI
jgi:hypothetical protein